MSNLSRGIIGIIVMDLLLAGGGWYVYGSASRAHASAAGLARDIRAAEAKQEATRSIGTAFADIEADRAVIDAAFIDPKTLVRFIENLEGMAARAGVVLSIESASLPQTADGYPSFRLTASGSFSGIYRFVALLETMKYFIAFDRVHILKEPAAKQPWSAAIQFQLLSFSAAL